MTIHEPRTEEQLLPVEAPASPGPRARNGATKTKARSKRADYRLRGLDLDAPGLAEPSISPARKRHPSLRRHRRRRVVQWIVVLTVIATVAVMLRAYVVQPFSVSSPSMVPTLQVGTDVLVVKSTRLIGRSKVGDIVVFHAPKGATCSAGGGNSHDLIKRVIGLPGQTISSARGSIYINGKRLNEPGWYNPPFGEVGPTRIVRTTIPRGHYFVMGDNRTDSCDSRVFGPIARSSLVGRVVATIAHDGHPFVHSI